MFPLQRPFGSGVFQEYYRCYSFRKLTFGGEKAETANYGGKIILPQSALAKLASLHIEYPMLFRLDQENLSTHVGVLEFTAEEGRAYVPEWAMQQIKAQDGDLIQLTNVTLPLGKFLKIQPQSVDFLDIHDPKAVLENALRNYSTLTLGDIISINYNSKIYRLLCQEVNPNGSGISIVETDLEVDFAPPVGYEEPKHPRNNSTSASSSSLKIDAHKVEEANKRFSAFTGKGDRLSGRPLTEASPLQNGEHESVIKRVDENIPPATLRLPKNKLWFGYDVKPKSEKKSNEETRPTQEPGKTLR